MGSGACAPLLFANVAVFGVLALLDPHSETGARLT